MTTKKNETKIETNLPENTEPVRAPLQSDPISSESDFQSVRASGGTPLQIPAVQSAPFAQHSVENLLTDACRQSGINPKTLLDWAIKENRVILINSRGEKSITRWPPA